MKNMKKKNGKSGENLSEIGRWWCGVVGGPQRQKLQELVKSLAKPKVIAGEVLDGPGLVRLIQEMVEALNARDIPTAGSILEHFNKDLVLRVRPFSMSPSVPPIFPSVGGWPLTVFTKLTGTLFSEAEHEEEELTRRRRGRCKCEQAGKERDL